MALCETCGVDVPTLNIVVLEEHSRLHYFCSTAHRTEWQAEQERLAAAPSKSQVKRLEAQAADNAEDEGHDVEPVPAKRKPGRPRKAQS